jgi:hypothetical protein
MVANGPMPGSTPISVPIRHPIRQRNTFWTDRMTEKPTYR